MKESNTFGTLIFIQKLLIHNISCVLEMATSSTSQKQQADDIPEFVLQFEGVEWKPTNHLPLLTLFEGNTYFQNARNLFVNGPCKKALTLNIPANEQQLFTFWATAHVLSGRIECGIEYKYIQGYI